MDEKRIQHHYVYSNKLKAAIGELDPQSIAYADAERGMREGDPVTTLADSLAQYAERYGKAHGPLSEDGVLGQGWLSAYHGINTLLNGLGHFDGGTLSHRLYVAAKLAGFEDREL